MNRKEEVIMSKKEAERLTKEAVKQGLQKVSSKQMIEALVNTIKDHDKFKEEVELFQERMTEFGFMVNNETEFFEDLGISVDLSIDALKQQIGDIVIEDLNKKA